MRRHNSVKPLHMRPEGQSHIVPGFTGPGKTIRTSQFPTRHTERAVTIDIPVEHLFTGRGGISEHA